MASSAMFVGPTWFGGSDSATANRADVYVPEYSGRVKCINDAGYGFIQCADTHAHWKRDVYVSAVDLRNAGCFAGTNVTFQVKVVGDGRPQARNVCQGFRGKVKSFCADKGFGIIECNETLALFGCDVYLQKSEIGDAQCSDEVFFKLKMYNGKPQAQCVSIAKLGRCRSEFAKQDFRGKIRSFGVEKGFGFIECKDTFDHFGYDVYLQASEIGDAQCLDEVLFKVKLFNGKPQARCVRIAKRGPLSSSDVEPSRIELCQQDCPLQASKLAHQFGVSLGVSVMMPLVFFYPAPFVTVPFSSGHNTLGNSVLNAENGLIGSRM